MSGLFGVVDSRRAQPIAPLVATMGAAMAHHAWHNLDTLCDAGMGLGRIGIGIFNSEKQPLESDEGGLAAFFTGELRHTTELRRAVAAAGYPCQTTADSELALRLYQAHGAQCVRQMEGAFLLAVWDRRAQELFLANDRMGLYPVYYAHQAGRLIFAPEVKGILCAPGFASTLDWTALAEYVRFQFLLGDKTFFEAIKLLPGAARLRYQAPSDTLTLETYWDMSQLPEVPPTITLAEAAEEAGRRLRNAVHELSGGPHQLGLYLSGGVDSRVILGFLPREVFPLPAVTYGLAASRDMFYARQVVRRQPGVRHHCFEIADGRWVAQFAEKHLTLTEGFHSWIHLHGMQILESVRPLMEVNLTGLHGAALNWEDAGLYHPPDDAAFENRLYELLGRDTTWPSLTDIEAERVFTPRLAKHLRGLAYDSFRAELARCSHWSVQQRAAHFSCETDRRFYQYYTVFHRSHLEQRFPFYDYRYFEFIHALPPELLFKRQVRRMLIRQQMPALAGIPYDKDNLPISATGHRRRLAQLTQKVARRLRLAPDLSPLNVDYENWLRHELRAWGEEVLFGAAPRAHAIFDLEFVRSLWRRHQAGRESNFIGKLAPLMTYEMFLRRWGEAAGVSQ